MLRYCFGSRRNLTQLVIDKQLEISKYIFDVLASLKIVLCSGCYEVEIKHNVRAHHIQTSSC